MLVLLKTIHCGVLTIIKFFSIFASYEARVVNIVLNSACSTVLLEVSAPAQAKALQVSTWTNGWHYGGYMDY